MDPSTSAAQDAQQQQPTTQPASSLPLIQNDPKSIQQPKNPISVGMSKEGSSMIMTENPDVDDEDEELQVARQETKTRAGLGQGGDEEDENLQTVSVSPQGGVDVAEQAEIQPSVPEFSAGSPEVEKFVEKSPDQEKPDIPSDIQALGVTQSGPGIIDLSQRHFDEAPIPVTFAQAVELEKKTHLNDSKHWLMGKIMYLWRRLNPGLGTKRMRK